MTTTTNPETIPKDFTTHLLSSNRILALLGAGLSASSGLPTFRGAGGIWRANDATSLATPEAFHANPSLVWQFYSYRRHQALKAQPNAAHYALAELARKKPNDEFLTISQNVDGLSQRAGHKRGQGGLELLHGSLFETRCTGFECDFVDEEDLRDPIVEALRLEDGGEDISSAEVPLKEVGVNELPHCPKCHEELLRPG